jgi:hypothetical protein
MEQFVIEWNETYEVLKLLASYIGGLVSVLWGIRVYMKRKGIKPVAIEKILQFKSEHAELEKIITELRRRISEKELNMLLDEGEKLIEKQMKGETVVKADVEALGSKFLQALMSVEKPDDGKE